MQIMFRLRVQLKAIPRKDSVAVAVEAAGVIWEVEREWFDETEKRLLDKTPIQRSNAS